MNSLLNVLHSWPRIVKQLIALGTDIAMCVISVWIAFYLRTGVFHACHEGVVMAAISSVVIAVPIFIFSGLYRAVFRYEGFVAALKIGEAMMAYGLIYFSLITIVGFEKVPRTLGLIQPFVLLVFIASSRVFVRFVLSGEYLLQMKASKLPRVIIYGAGNTGRQLSQALLASNTTRVAAFVDDDKSLQGCSIYGIRVYKPQQIPKLLEKYDSNLVLLAIPSASRTRRKEIIEWLQKFPCEVKVLPSLDMIANGQITLSALHDVKVEDLLGRDQVLPDDYLMNRNIKDKVVLVTGAGGSIGSELCRQIAKVGPETLLLVERSEFALYAIYHELKEKIAPNVRAIPLLADVTDELRLIEIMQRWHPSTVYHAAAYKHVPMVEHNPLEGIKNNVFGTLITARVARDEGVSNFVLISTDKAVRPTNVMGATKRLCELELQAIAASNPQKTVFSMVRFGNVLGSSGSVVPRFKEQIRMGGPITLTDKEIVRYFMTIPEASQLVIQAGAMGTGGDVFLLDMGSPVRIYDLACRMIELSGMKVKDPEHPDGDIEIVLTGLRPGEKLYEELLIKDNPNPTNHPRIFKAVEKMIPAGELSDLLDQLDMALAKRDRQKIFELLKRSVPEFQPKDEEQDWIIFKGDI